MDINIKIQAPELVDAINSLATAIAGTMELLLHNYTKIEESTTPPVTNTTAVIPLAKSGQTATEQSTTVPTTTQTYTMEQLAIAATQLVDAGRREELVNLLSSFGVQALTALPKKQYGAFATALRQMGAKI